MISKKVIKLLLIISGLGVLLLIILQIWANNTLASYGAKLTEIIELENQIKLDNEVMIARIAQLSSLYRIASQAAEVGFTVPKKIEYIK